jgi:hypothetical protein
MSQVGELPAMLRVMAQREVEKVTDLGKQIGFGRIMQICTQAWGDFLVERGLPRTGAFVVGPCQKYAVPCVCATRDGTLEGSCDWCCGSGWLTPAVRALVDKQPKKKKASSR